ncbi:hypothetical protein EMCG_04714 [[Emmonsia] crescens]|uniref:HNH nuclease domain-containing protein n=1 Tax=[Emmonsia] crescens TaxID=73230 RepID=A0A0G2HRH3_9EURO|nr:hypothetical protein EMCG_04714 [Emmonsia crescens UAMH 3008]
MDKKVADDKIGPGVELHDPARLKLLEELQKFFGSVPQKAQASLLLCALKYLQGLCKSSANYVLLHGMQSVLANQTVDNICKNHDAHRCVVTKLAGPLNAAHIVPFFLNKKNERASFFNLLKSLFAQRIEKWKSLLDNGTEFVENVLSLTPTLHHFHSAGLFGLQPIEASLDGKSLKLKFYWIAQQETTSNTMVNLMDIPTFPNDVELEDIKICNAKDGHIIKSGEVIKLTKSDPEQHPLPTWDMLELQWIMQRLTALKGPADIPDSVLTESEDSRGIYDEDLGEYIWWDKNGQWRGFAPIPDIFLERLGEDLEG